MTDKQRQLQNEALTPLSALFAIFATVAAIGVAVLISPAGHYTASEANAAVAAAPEQAAGAGEHAEFIRQAHGRVALEAEDSPLPPTF